MRKGRLSETALKNHAWVITFLTCSKNMRHYTYEGHGGGIETDRECYGSKGSESCDNLHKSKLNKNKVSCSLLTLQSYNAASHFLQSYDKKISPELKNIFKRNIIH